MNLYELQFKQIVFARFCSYLARSFEGTYTGEKKPIRRSYHIVIYVYILYISVSSPLRQFDTVYKAHTPSNNHKTLHGLSAEACARACEQESSFSCRSFDYNSAAKKCILSKAYRETVSIISSKEYDYYELSKYYKSLCYYLY